MSSILLIPHKTNKTTCSGRTAATTVGTGEKNSPANKQREINSNEDKQQRNTAQSPSNQHGEQNSCQKVSGNTHVRDLLFSFDKVPIVLSSASSLQKSTRCIQGGDRYIFLVEDSRTTRVNSVSRETESGTITTADDDAFINKTGGTDHEDEHEGEEDGEFSDAGSEGSLEEVRQHHGIIKTQKQDDPDYLTLFEAHQKRLEDVGAPTTGQECS